MPDFDFSDYLNERFTASQITPHQMDFILAKGWRHFGTEFFRYNFGFYENEIRRVFPLRIRTANFILSKSQHRILRKNADLSVKIQPIFIDREKEKMFDSHKKRFSHGTPETIFDFLSREPAEIPCEALEIGVYRAEKLLAASFFDVGETSVSSIYGMFDPQEHSRSLGIFTMLLEIEFARKHGKAFYYQGYCYEGNSFYDYKKRFSALESYDWHGNWTDFSAQ